MKNLVIITFLFSLSLNLFSQGRNDALYLKNGSIIRGKIIQNETDKKVSIESNDGNLWVFQQNEIDSFKFKVVENVNVSRFYSNRLHYNLSGAYLGMNERDEFKNTISLQFGARYNVFRFLNVGLATGIEFFDTQAIPVLVEIEMPFYQRERTLFVLFQGGYAWAIGKVPPEDYYYQDLDYAGGWKYAAEGGLRFVSKNFATQLSLGYHYQELTSTYKEYWGWLPELRDVERTDYYRRMFFKIALIF